MRKALLLFFLAFPFFSVLFAQTSLNNTYTWEQFAEEFLATTTDDEDEENNTEMLEILEEIHQHPFDINTATKDDFTQLSFLNETKIDSIISYRQRKGFFYNLGELMFVSALDFEDRQRLPLFLFCGQKAESKSIPLSKKIYKGHHDILTRLDIPLYEREGNRKHSDAELLSNPNSVYQGNGLHHVLRYRYHYAKDVRYGLTLDKGAGEPFALFDNYPYDYVSAYFQTNLNRKDLNIILGDFRIRTGMGLLLGNALFTNGYYEATSPKEPRTSLLPHTNASTVGYFRGAAAQIHWKHLELLGFLSYRKYDARLDDDTIRNFKTDGYHRTLLEIDQKNSAACFSIGGRAAYRNHRGVIGINLLAAHYDKPVQPTPAHYNQYYFTGKSYAALSADYYWHRSRFEVKGELAFDRNLHFAWTNLLHYRPTDDLLLTFGTRYFEKQFQTLFGKTTAKNSRLQNEQALTFGLTYKGFRLWNIAGYAEVYHFPAPVYRNQQSTNGVELRLNLSRTLSQRLKATFSYRSRIQEYGITDFSYIKEYIATHRFTLNVTHATKNVNTTATIGATYYRPQTDSDSYGWLAALRSNITLSKRITTSLFSTIFLTDNEQSGISIYTPQLSNAASFVKCTYKGFSTVATLNYSLSTHFSLGMRLGTLHYFDKPTISSGLQAIMSSWKNDLSLQIRWRL